MTETDILRAEQKVRNSTAEFEQAMNHLEEIVQEGSDKVARTVEKVQDKVEAVQEKINRPRRALEHFAARSKEVARQGRDLASHYSQRGLEESRRLYSQARISAEPAVEHVRENRGAYLTAAAFIGLGLTYYFWQKRRQHRAMFVITT